MLDIKRIRENFEEVAEGLRRRGADVALVEKARDLDANRRALVTKTDELKTSRNMRSKEIGALKKAGQNTDAVQAEVRAIGDQIAVLDDQIRQVEEELQTAMLRIPNVPCKTIPTGPDSSANRVVRFEGTAPTFVFKPLDHIALGEKLGIFDLQRATKITGSGFPLLLGIGSKLQRALIQYMLDLHTEKQGYTEMLPPFVVNTASMRGTGQLPKMAEDMYHCEVDDFWLIPTAEVPVTNYFRDEIIERPLPVYLTAYTPCFRREAGSAGKDTRGIKRVHQFDKVEMVKFVVPETSYDELEKLVGNAEDVLKGLGLHYRILELCSGTSAFRPRSVTISNCGLRDSRSGWKSRPVRILRIFRLAASTVRYRDENGKSRLVHTLNGSGVALPRLMIAILEQCQQADGSVLLPEAIRPYMRGVERLVPVK